MRSLTQVAHLTAVNLLTIPERRGTSLVIVIGITGVVGVLVSVLAMAEGFRHTLASTGRPGRVIMLRAGSDAELSSGVDREQTTLLAALAAFALRDEVRLVEGRLFRRGVREVIVGRKAAQQFAGLEVGSRIAFRDSDW